MWDLENGSEEPIQGKNRDAHIENRCVDMGVCVCVVGVAGKRRWDELGNWDRHL